MEVHILVTVVSWAKSNEVELIQQHVYGKSSVVPQPK